MRKVIDNDILTLVSRLIVGGMFIYASLYKIADPGSFAKSIWFYHLAPGSVINLMAIILPWLEVLAGITLIIGIFYRGAVLWVNVMLVIFIIALTTTIARGISIDCGCFKAAAGATHSAWDAVLRDIGALILSIQLWMSRSQRWLLAKS